MASRVRPSRELEARGKVAFSFRPFAGPDDYRRLVEVRAACEPVDGEDEVVTVEDLAHFIENPVGMDPTRDLLLAEIDDQVLGYGWVNHRIEAGGDEIHMLRIYIHPGRRRQGMGSAMLERIEARSQAWETRPRGDRNAFLQSIVADTELSGLAFFPSLGFTPVRYAFKMERDLRAPIPAVPLPEGVELRPVDESQDRAIWEAEREAFQDHWGYTPWDEAHFQRFTRFPHYERSLWRVAWEGDQVAGMVLNYINPEENLHYGRRRGYTEDIAVRRPWRRRGLASALIASSLTALADRGMTEAALAVDAENPTGALRVYERLGYQPIKQWTFFRRRLEPPPIGGDPHKA